MKFSPVLFYTVIVSLGGFIFGFDASVISGTVNFVVTEFELNAIEQGFVVSAPTLGAIIATLSAGIISDRIGRRNLLILIAFLYLVSAVASALATGYWMLVVARFIGGLAFCSLMIAPIYIAEISPADKRGKMVSINQLNIMLGFSVAYFSNYYLLQIAQTDIAWSQFLGIDQYTWRWMLGLEALPAALWFAMLFLIPRSPRWLALQHRDEEATRVLKTLHGEEKEEQSYRQELEEIRQSCPEKDLSIRQQLGQLFGPKMRFALTVGLIVGIAQQITGINAIYFYAPSIFEQSGVGTNAAFAQAIWIGIINIIFTVAAMLLIDKLGRKPLLTLGLAGVFVSMSLCAYGFSQATYTLTQSDINVLEQKDPALTGKLDPLTNVTFDSDVAFKRGVTEVIGLQGFNRHQGDILQKAASMNATIILAGILGFVASFAFSLGPVMWVMFSEIFPNHIRAIAISFVGVINSIVSFTVQFMFPWELENLGSAMTFMIFGGFAVLGLVLVVRLFPETKGKSLEALEAELTTSKSQPSALNA